MLREQPSALVYWRPSRSRTGCLDAGPKRILNRGYITKKEEPRASCPPTSSSKMRLLGLSAAVVALLASSTTAHGDHAHDHHEQHALPVDEALVAANQVRSTWPSAPTSSQLTFAVEQSLLWGTYRPNLYFGLRPRLPSSLLTGLVWFGAHDFLSYKKARHACDQGDGLVYTFTEHDGRGAAVQVVKDQLNNVEMTMNFLKVPAPEGGE